MVKYVVPVFSLAHRKRHQQASTDRALLWGARTRVEAETLPFGSQKKNRKHSIRRVNEHLTPTASPAPGWDSATPRVPWAPQFLQWGCLPGDLLGYGPLRIKGGLREKGAGLSLSLFLLKTEPELRSHALSPLWSPGGHPCGQASGSVVLMGTGPQRRASLPSLLGAHLGNSIRQKTVWPHQTLSEAGGETGEMSASR